MNNVVMSKSIIFMPALVMNNIKYFAFLGKLLTIRSRICFSFLHFCFRTLDMRVGDGGGICVTFPPNLLFTLVT